MRTLIFVSSSWLMMACGGSVASSGPSTEPTVDGGAGPSSDAARDDAASKPLPCENYTCADQPDPPPATGSCPLTAPPHSSTSCQSEGLTCNYGECQPVCVCTHGSWSCTQDDCEPPTFVCPPTVTPDSPCSQILAKCDAGKANKFGCICSIEMKWKCGPLN